MKTSLSLRRIAFLALALGTASVTAAFAQTTTNAPATTAPAGATGFKHHHQSVLTADEKTQLKKAHDAALAADPTLQSDQASLKQKFQALKAQGSSATKDDWKALRQQGREFHAKLRAAELKADPSLAPIFDKLKAAHKGWHHSST